MRSGSDRKSRRSDEASLTRRWDRGPPGRAGATVAVIGLGSLGASRKRATDGTYQKPLEMPTFNAAMRWQPMTTHQESTENK
jgi:hypothetical protein